MKDTDTSTVCICNRMFSEHTLHPLASVINLSKPCREQQLSLDCYAVMITDSLPYGACCEPCNCDYAAATVTFAPPGEHIEAEGELNGRLLLFHPDLTKAESLGTKMPGYTFFYYHNDNEALHLSVREKRLLERCTDFIDEELHWGIDRFSRTLLCNKIELLLNYCLRFYERQFILRHDINHDTISKISERIDNYLLSGCAATKGLPRPDAVAAWAGHSEPYTSDMLHNETGFTTAEYVEKRRMDVARHMLTCSSLSISDIAHRLGFACKSTFCRLFEQCNGCSAAQYRNQ